MKSPIILVLFMFVGISTFSQSDTVWFDAKWQETTKDKAQYYRPKPKKKKKGYWVVDYYKNGQVQMEGFSKTNLLFKEEFDGIVTHYHSTGAVFKKIKYKKGKKNGVWKTFYETGELKELGTYQDGKDHGVWKAFHKNGKIKSKGKYQNGDKVGVWKTFYKNEY